MITEGTVAGITFNVVGVIVLTLKEMCCGTTRCMSTYINAIRWGTSSGNIRRYDVKVAEPASEVISVINLLLHFVKAAGCSPVRGSAADASHTSQSLTVTVPVWSVVVNWCVLRKIFSLYLRQIFVYQAP